MPGKSIINQLLFERPRFFFTEISNDTVDAQVDDGLATFSGEEEGAVFLLVDEEIFGEDCRAERMLEDVERLLKVRIAVGRNQGKG